MAEKPGAHGAKDVAAIGALLALLQRNIDAMNGAVKLALESMQAIANRHGDFVSEAHHQLALMLWRGAMPPTLDGTPAVSLEIAKRVIETSRPRRHGHRARSQAAASRPEDVRAQRLRLLEPARWTAPRRRPAPSRELTAAIAFRLPVAAGGAIADSARRLQKAAPPCR